MFLQKTAVPIGFLIISSERLFALSLLVFKAVHTHRRSVLKPVAVVEPF